ncbi:MAG TPA: N-acetylmuramoyl-L-alanine amidase [Myxococcota bacterium]
MKTTTLLPSLAVAVALLVGTSTGRAQGADDADPSVAAFVAIKKDVEALRADPEKKKFRHNYERLIVRLQATANTYKEGSRADDCAFVAAQLLEELAQVSVVSADRAAAVDAFSSMAERFPRSNLADDALVAAARLTDDVVRGRAMIDKVVAMKTADMKKEAVALKNTRFTDAKVKAAKSAVAKKPSLPEAPTPMSTPAIIVAEAPKPEAAKVDAPKVEAKLEPVKVAEAPKPTTTATTTTTTTTTTTSAPSTPLVKETVKAALAKIDAAGVDSGHGHGHDGEDDDDGAPLVPPTSKVNTLPPTLSDKPLAEMMVPSPMAQPASSSSKTAGGAAANDAPTMTASSKPAARPLPTTTLLPERPKAGTPARKVMVIRHEKTRTESVVRLRISGEVGVLKGEVPPSAGGNKKIFYDVSPAKLGQRNIQPIEVHDGVVSRVRAGQYDTDIVRLVIELEGNKEPVLNITKKPFELVLTSPLPLPKTDVVAGALPGPIPVQQPDAEEVKARLSQSLGKIGAVDGVSISAQLGLRVHRVVIDAGHGGHDTGAIGPSGLREKDVTLALAKLVKDKLAVELPDVEVIMTRDDDRTLALQDRTNTANSAAADLFISIHCNASPLKRVRGVETYYLNITHDRYAMRLAARENAELGDGSISDLDFILADLAMKSNVDDSVRLGRSVQKSMMKKLHASWPDVPDLGLKHALFYVLMGNRMPSILVETSFLSNKMEEKRLASAEYQDAIANGVVEGVRAFVADRQAFYTDQ